MSKAKASPIFIDGYDSFASPVINLMVGYELPRSGEQSVRPTS